MTISEIAIHNAPDDVRIEYCMEQHRLPPEERSEDYYFILGGFGVDELPKELRPVEIRKLPDSGEISLFDIGEEAGFAVGEEVRINYKECRDLIGKPNAVEMAFSEWYGASNVPPINWGAGTIVSTGGISRYYQEEGYGTAACRSFSVGSNTTYTAIAMGARKQGASARGQARPCLWNNTSTGGGSSYSNFKYFKWKAGSIEQECLNQTWRTSSYVVETPGWPAKTYYFADALSITTAEALWNAMNTDIGKLTFWFGNDA